MGPAQFVTIVSTTRSIAITVAELMRIPRTAYSMGIDRPARPG
jgi:hypothetical protein